MNLLLLSLGLGAVPNIVRAPAQIAFVATAGEPYPDPYFVNDDRERLKKMGYSIVEVDVTKSSREVLLGQLSSVDAIFVAGGNTFYLMQQIRFKNLESELADLVRSGKAYIGASAGAVIMGPTIAPVQTLDDPKAAPNLSNFEGLNVVEFVVLPHYGKEKYLERYRKIVDEYKDRHEIIPLRDDQALVVTDSKSYAVVDSALILHDKV